MTAERMLDFTSASDAERARLVAAAAELMADWSGGCDPWTLLRRAAQDLRANPQDVEADAETLHDVLSAGVAAKLRLRGVA